jgi:putative transposase
VKYQVICTKQGKYPVSVMCEFFHVSRSGYYGFIRKKDKPSKDSPLAQLVAQCQVRCLKTYGYRRVHLWLIREKSLYLNPKTVLRIMNKYGLLSEIRRYRKYRQMGQQLHRYENLLNREFTANKPNQKWVTDISYIHTGQGVLYLSVIRDLFDKSIVAYKTAASQTVNLVLSTIRQAIRNERVAAELQLHSDQGFQYTSSAYFNLTKEYGITPSMSRRGNCYDNAMAENFFSILKTECIHRSTPKTFAVARELIDEYIDFYNHERIQTKTHLTPFEKRSQAA